MFTMGQTERMRAALNSSVSGRKYLWTEENLAETGTNNGYVAPMCAPVADFVDEVPEIIPNDTIQFIDYTYNSTSDAWSWIFEDGEPSASNEQNPHVAYSKPGLYNVSLTVSNSAGTNTLTRNKLVFVIDTLRGIVAPAIVDMEDSEFPEYPADFYKTWTFQNNGDYNWELYSSADNRAMRIKNYENKVGTINTLITSNINISEIDNSKIYFDYAYARRNSSSADQLRVYISFDCGKNWILKFVNSGSSLSTSNSQYVVSSFIPQQDEWATGEIDISRYADKNYMKIKFQVVSKGGNYLYIDNLNIGKTTSISNKGIISNSLKLYPNPASDNLTVRFNSSCNQNVIFSITGVLGNVVYAKNINIKAGENIDNINLNELNIVKGIYLVMISGDNNKIAKRLIVK
jgi:PKD repeat protein